jgi:rhodanese-related sulfurtransferase
MKAIYGMLLLTLIGLNACQSQNSEQMLEALEFSEMIANDKQAIVLDVRTPAEFREGHIPDARNMDYYKDNFETDLDQLDKEKSYYVYCTVGGRSSSVANLMQQKGFKHVYNLKGGIDAWETHGLPITLTSD